MSIPELAKILGLLAAVIALAELAKKTRVPYPTLMVMAGLLISVMPGMPKLDLDPDLIFLVFLPPILYSAAWNTWLEDFRRHAGPISFLAIGLVLATAILVAQICVMVIPGMGWWHGFLLGAIVSPPDAAAATAIAWRPLPAGPQITTSSGCGRASASPACTIAAHSSSVSASAAAPLPGTLTSALDSDSRVYTAGGQCSVQSGSATPLLATTR